MREEEIERRKEGGEKVGGGERSDSQPMLTILENSQLMSMYYFSVVLFDFGISLCHSSTWNEDLLTLLPHP